MGRGEGKQLAGRGKKGAETTPDASTARGGRARRGQRPHPKLPLQGGSGREGGRDHTQCFQCAVEALLKVGAGGFGAWRPRCAASIVYEGGDGMAAVAVNPSPLTPPLPLPLRSATATAVTLKPGYLTPPLNPALPIPPCPSLSGRRQRQQQ